jgi:hypothetical protein
MQAELEEAVASSMEKDNLLERAWGDVENLKEQLADQVQL